MALTHDPTMIHDNPSEDYQIKGKMAENEQFVDMLQFHIAWKLCRMDLSIQTAFERTFSEIIKTGVRISSNDREITPTPAFAASLKKNYVENALRGVLFTRLVTGFVIFTKIYVLGEEFLSSRKRKALQKSDPAKFSRVEAVPFSPPWGDYIISEETVRGGPVKYRIYMQGSNRAWRREKHAYIKRVDGHENSLSRFKDSIGTTLVPNRLLLGMLQDSDMTAYSVLSNPPLVKEIVPEPEKTSRDALTEGEIFNKFFSSNYTAMMDDTTDRSDEANARMRLVLKKAQEEREKVRIFRRMLNEESIGKEIGLAIGAVTQSAANQITLEPNRRLVSQQLPVLRPDLHQYVQQLQNVMHERLGHIPNSAVLEKSGRSRQTDAKTLEDERRNAIQQWTNVGSNALTAMYQFIYENPALFEHEASRLYGVDSKGDRKRMSIESSSSSPRAGVANKIASVVLSRIPEPTTEVTLNYAHTMSYSVLQSLKEDMYITPERYMKEVLIKSGASRSMLQEIVSESRTAGLLEVIKPKDLLKQQGPQGAPKNKKKKNKKKPEKEGKAPKDKNKKKPEKEDKALKRKKDKPSSDSEGEPKKKKKTDLE